MALYYADRQVLEWKQVSWTYFYEIHHLSELNSHHYNDIFRELIRNPSTEVEGIGFSVWRYEPDTPSFYYADKSTFNWNYLDDNVWLPMDDSVLENVPYPDPTGILQKYGLFNWAIYLRKEPGYCTDAPLADYVVKYEP
jgi:hypothetical protein